jgi:hypothetical protein
VSDSECIQIGAKVRILQPDYVAERTGVVISPEELPDGQRTGRWIIQVDDENILLSLVPEEFEVIA